MNCKLCQKTSPLRNSHIIPEFVFTSLYDEKHRMNVLSTRKQKPRPFEQKGLREKLLCATCETKFSQLELYANTAFDGKSAERPLAHIIVVKGVDYKKFKLFLLSVLWRASISSLEFFSEVDLGRHEEILRKMILAEDPGASDKYGIVPFALVDGHRIETGLIMQPSRENMYGQVGYRFIFGGFLWAYFVSSLSAPNSVKPLLPREDNTLCIVESEYSECGLVRDFARDLKRLGRI
jgi:hypothetical protein